MSIITNVRTIRLEQFPNSIWVEIETDENLTGQMCIRDRRCGWNHIIR